jgi:hypothetical protein
VPPQLSASLALRTAGRRHQLVEPGGAALELAAQLSLQPWREDEPDYLKLEVFRGDSEGLAAFYWAPADSEAFEYFSDWLQLWVERDSAQPGE